MSTVYSATALEKMLRTALLKHFETEMTSIVPRLCMIEQSSSDKEGYEHLGHTPVMEEFKDEVKFSALSDTKYELENKIYTGGLNVSRDTLRRNQTASIMTRIRQLSQRAQSFYVKLLMEAIEDNGNCYDGGAMFADAHPARKNEGGTQDNNLALTGTTVANLQTDLALGVAAMEGFNDEEGEPFHGDGVDWDLHVVCAPSLKYNMSVALNASIISQTSNVNAGLATLSSSPRLTTDTFYLFRTNGPKPFICQEEQAVQFEPVESGSTAVVKRQYEYVVSLAGAAGYGFWQSGIKFS